MSTYYISTGELTRMYTLRVRYMDTAVCEGESYKFERDEYIKNLSIDSQKAKDSAKAWLDAVRGEGKYTLSTSELPSLEEIRRGEDDARRIAREEREAELERQYQDRLHAQVQTIHHGHWPFGVWQGEEFNRAPNSYILFWINLEEPEGTATVLQEVLKKRFPALADMPKPNGEYYGTEGTREEFTATCIAIYGFEGYYGWTNIIKFVKDSGELLVYMGSGNVDVDLADTVTFTAGIKAHEEYDGEKQTKIQRITKLRGAE